jgi:hypothetical protein
VLGVLSRSEIEDYAARSHAIWEPRYDQLSSSLPILPYDQLSSSLPIQPPRRLGREDRLKIGKPEAMGKAQGKRKENVTATGLGGAATSLLDILSEAAEGL